MSPASRPKRAGLSSGNRKVSAAANMVNAIGGRVIRSSLRLPRLSIVQTAGIAPMKLTKPKMVEASRAWNREKPESRNIVELKKAMMLIPQSCWASMTVKAARVRVMKVVKANILSLR